MPPLQVQMLWSQPRFSSWLSAEGSMGVARDVAARQRAKEASLANNMVMTMMVVVEFGDGFRSLKLLERVDERW